MRRRAPCAPVWAFGTIPSARDMPVACFARWYTWLRPEAASLDGEARGISARSRPRPHSLTPITVLLVRFIRLWYDIAVFVAVLSFHSARYRSDYGPRRPFEARVISARSRPRLRGLRRHRSPCVALVRYDSGMTAPFSQLCFRSIVHDIAAAMSRRPVCYHTFAKSLRFTRHHTQLPFEMVLIEGSN